MIDDLINKLKNEIKKIDNIEEKIDVMNDIKKQLSEVSPLKEHPADCIQWIKSDAIIGNVYNPNKVAPPEMKLLIKSIEEDGYTMPIVVYKENRIEVVDGFHRTESLKRSKKIAKSTYNRLPVSFIRQSQTNISNRMAATIRHNRARGTHDIDLMMNIVGELKNIGIKDRWIMKHIGMDADELLRLKQLSGLADLFKDKEFSNSWEIAK